MPSETKLTQVLQAVRTKAQTAVTKSIVFGALPPDDGISMALATGALDETFLDKGQNYHASVVINAKSADQLNALEWLSVIHETLTLTEEYPSGENWQIANIETTGIPMYLGREENRQYEYGSSVRIDFYMKG